MKIFISYAPKLMVACLSLSLMALAGCGGSNGGGKKSSSSASVASSVSSVASSVVSSSVSSVESSSSSSSVSSSGWTMVWNDEFEGTAIDASKWGYEKNCWGGGNNEQQCYTDQAKNAFVESGVLNIVAVKEDFTGPDSADGGGTATKTLPYTSARLRTKNLQEWTFGRFEIRAKLPAGQGTWPAIWMLPTDSPYGVWAASGEIDIMEAVNLETVTNGVIETNVYGTLHFGRTWPGNTSSGAPYKLPNSASPADDFHVYAMEWEDGEIRWYVDGVHYQTQRQEGWYSQYMVDGVLTDAPVGAPFDKDSAYHLLLNLAVGGSWAGNTNNTGIDASVFPQTLQVDYVRVYECSASPTTGKGCATVDNSVVLNPGKQRPGIGPVELPGPPLFVMYDDELTTGLKFDSYNPDSAISYSEIDESGRGKVFNVVKTGANGNVFFKVNGDPTDLRNWSSDSELIFDVKVNSKAAGAKLLVKMDSVWPNVSDVEVPVGADGVWTEYRITLADLIDNGNSLSAGGKATLASIANTFVIDPSAAMDVSFDNVRIEGEEVVVPEYFAPTPLFNIYEDGAGTGLQIQSYNPNGQISSSQVTETGRGNVFNVVKTGATGSFFFNITAGPGDLGNWVANGKLEFDLKVNSLAAGTKLLIKIDSGWPNVSDVEVTLPATGTWGSFSIDVSDLLDNGNSFDAGKSANIAAITNIFVMEPSGVMDVSFDNVRLVAATPPFKIYEDNADASLQVQSYNPAGQITSSEIVETGRGDVFNVVKTGATGNVFFNVTAGSVDLSSWTATGKLTFDLKVNSLAAGSKLLVKIDSGWPNVSDVEVTLPATGTWGSFSIDVSDLLDNGNSFSSGNFANIGAIANIFVMEPSGAMDVSFDNIRLETP